MNCLRAFSCAVAAAFLLSAAATNAAVIPLIDAGGVDDGSGSNFQDLSTDGDSAAGITGTFASSAVANYAAVNVGATAAARWDGSEFDYQPASTETATWTFGGLPIGAEWDVFAAWHTSAVPQGNLSQMAPYTIQGGAPILINQEPGTAGDLVLTDANSNPINFQKLGTATVNGAGDVIVTLSGAADDWVIADAIALRAVPEPSTLALCGLSLLCLAAWRRRS